MVGFIRVPRRANPLQVSDTPIVGYKKPQDLAVPRKVLDEPERR